MKLTTYSFCFKTFILLVLGSQWGGLVAQEAPKSITAKFIESSITLDGNLDEEVWQTADVAKDFWQYFPTDSLLTANPTTVKVLYDETTLYVGFYAQSTSGDYVVSTLRRDFGGTTNDNVSLLFDTFNDGTNAFFFGITPYGVRREGLVSDGGNDFNNTWDIKWRAEAQRFDDHYTIEVAIPFTSLKFEEGATKWRFRPYRWNIQTNESSTWVKVPQQQRFSSLAFMGELIFERPLGKSRTPFAVIPYINALSQKDFTTNQTDSEFLFGGDAKIAIGDGLNLDLTINPDFSNVEVDDIFTNLTRFELRLPERRQFFIDNNDLFDNFGNTFNEADLWLLTSRVNITFSKSLFWSTIFQYSNQRDNLGINSRLQWRYAPLSDLYLVYNDNYRTSVFEPRFRSINLKVTYWLNI